MRLKTLLTIIFLTFTLSSCATHRVPTLPPDHTLSVYGGDMPEGMRASVYHLVAPGETLWRIAEMYNVDMELIKKTNRIADVRDIDIGKKLYIPNAAPRKHVLTLYPSKKWRYIIIHHSATDSGNSSEFNKAHLRKGWEGIGYHFVIDNGTCGKDAGQIETSPRWVKQRNGAHCKAGGMNEKGIGICLVGNFSKEEVNEAQMRSLVFLVDTLRKNYHIPNSNIMGHGVVKGARTECPGKRFPWQKFWSLLK